MNDTEKEYWDAFCELKVGWLAETRSVQFQMFSRIDPQFTKVGLCRYLSMPESKQLIDRLGVHSRELDKNGGWE